MDSLIGEIIMFAGNFAPRGWAFCHGQLLAINSNQALFSILGTTYGGDGRTTFALPDLRSRVPVCKGTGPGLSPVALGERKGIENQYLNTNTMPAHNHVALMKTGPDTSLSDVSTGNRLAHEATDGKDALPIYTSEAGTESMAADAIQVGNTGGSQPFNIRNPYLGINYIIAIDGVYPSRS